MKADDEGRLVPLLAALRGNGIQAVEDLQRYYDVRKVYNNPLGSTEGRMIISTSNPSLVSNYSS
jgi:hypothetical protein